MLGGLGNRIGSYTFDSLPRLRKSLAWPKALWLNLVTVAWEFGSDGSKQVLRWLGTDALSDFQASIVASPEGAVLALNSDSLKQERRKLLRAQESERRWAGQWGGMVDGGWNSGGAKEMVSSDQPCVQAITVVQRLCRYCRSDRWQEVDASNYCTYLGAGLTVQAAQAHRS